AEDGIRDRNVTGVQTCALPICARVVAVTLRNGDRAARDVVERLLPREPLELVRAARIEFVERLDLLRQFREARVRPALPTAPHRSEERRVGKEWRARWAPSQQR